MIGSIKHYYESYGSFYYTCIVVKDLIGRKIRQRILKRYFPHSNKINIGKNSRIMGIKNITIGNNFYCGDNFRLNAIKEHGGDIYNPKILIKNNVSITDNVQIDATSYIEIGNDVLLGSGVTMVAHNHGTYTGDNPDSPMIPPLKRKVSNDEKIIIEDNVWLAQYVTVTSGVTIGKGSIIGAGSVVAKDIPPFSIAVGVPAKVIKTYDFNKERWERIE